MIEAVPIRDGLDFKAAGHLDLPCAVCESDGRPMLVTRWRLGKQDIERIIETGHLHIAILGTRPPPMMVAVDDPRGDQ